MIKGLKNLLEKRGFLFCFLVIGREEVGGVEGEGENKSSADSMPYRVPDMGLNSHNTEIMT